MDRCPGVTITSYKDQI
jgi:NEDD8-activating enzyme E1